MDLATYLLSFDQRVTSQLELRAQIDARPEIVNWYAVMPASFLLVSALEPTALRKLLREHTVLAHDASTFLVVRVSAANAAGFIPREAWEFLTFPQPVRTEKPAVSPSPIPPSPRPKRSR